MAAWGGGVGAHYGTGSLTLFPPLRYLQCLFDRPLGKPVISQQHHDLIGVIQLPWHEGKLANRNLHPNRKGGRVSGERRRWRGEGVEGVGWREGEEGKGHSSDHALTV